MHAYILTWLLLELTTIASIIIVKIRFGLTLEECMRIQGAHIELAKYLGLEDEL